MKMPNEKFTPLKAAITAVVDHLGKDACRDHAEDTSHERMRWDLFFLADKNLRYSDDHPGFVSGRWPRVYPQYKGWNL